MERLAAFLEYPSQPGADRQGSRPPQARDKVLSSRIQDQEGSALCVECPFDLECDEALQLREILELTQASDQFSENPSGIELLPKETFVHSGEHPFPGAGQDDSRDTRGEERSSGT